MKTYRLANLLSAVTALALSAVSLHAASQSNGNFTVSASGNETGDLTVVGDGHFSKDIDFGTTGVSQSAVALYYSENGTSSTVGLTATRASASFLWQDNGVGTPKNKMLLGPDNSLSLFDAVGVAGIILNPTTGAITLAGSTSGIRLSDGTTLSSAASLRSTGLFTTNGTVAATVGTDGKVKFTNGITLGSNSTAAGSSATALGANASASGNYATALGSSTVASGVNALAAGNSATANGTTATAFGEGTIAQAYDSLVLGRFNVAQGNSTAWVTTDDLFTIGIGGNATTRANAFVVKKSGDVTASKNFAVSGTTTHTGTTTFNGLTTVNNVATFTKNITLTGNATNSVIAGNITLAGNTTTLGANTTATTGNATFAKNVAIAGNTTLNGTLTLADGTIIANAASLRSSALYTASGNVAVSVGTDGALQVPNGITLPGGPLGTAAYTASTASGLLIPVG